LWIVVTNKIKIENTDNNGFAVDDALAGCGDERSHHHQQ
jgi:hypothetical protein